MARFSALCMALAVVAFGAAANAQQAGPPAQTDAQTSEDVIVTGQRTRDAVTAFVGQMTAAPRHNNQLATWDASRTICPGVVGIKGRYAQFVLDRMAYRAEAVGLNVGEPGCHPDILIVITREPDAIAHQLVRQHPALMGQIQERGYVTLGRERLNAFENSDAPVRWWHVARTISRDGDAIGDTTDSSQDRKVSQGGGGAAVIQLSGGNSRVSAATHQSFGIAIVIVDANQLGGVGFPALADYLSMVTLARLDANADTSAFPTILNLFEPNAAQGAPTEMTAWDVAYLRGLYTAEPNARNSNAQNGQIADAMVRDLSHGATAASSSHGESGH